MENTVARRRGEADETVPIILGGVLQLSKPAR
jgi:hypothetical protein